MSYSSLFNHFLDKKTELSLHMDAMALADSIFVHRLNNTEFIQFFQFLEHKLSDLLCSGEENYFVKGLCFYHYFEQALIWNVQVKNPNILGFDYLGSESKSLNTYSKQIMVNALVHQCFPHDMDNIDAKSLKNFVMSLQGTLSYLPNMANLEEAKKYCYFEFITSEVQQIYDQSSKFGRQHAVNEAMSFIQNKQNSFNDSFSIFREKYLLEQSLKDNDTSKHQKLKI